MRTEEDGRTTVKEVRIALADDGPKVTEPKSKDGEAEVGVAEQRKGSEMSMMDDGFDIGGIEDDLEAEHLAMLTTQGVRPADAVEGGMIVRKYMETRGARWHMMRALGCDRMWLDYRVRDSMVPIGMGSSDLLSWAAYPFDADSPTLNGQWKGVDFLPSLKSQWLRFWPDPAPGVCSRTGVPAWDAIAGNLPLKSPRKGEFILVSAKSRRGDLGNPADACQAEGEALERIVSRLQQTHRALRIPGFGHWADVKEAWLGKYFMEASRLACLLFLNTRAKSPARLLNIGFIGDDFPDAFRSAAEWTGQLAEMYAQMGIVNCHALSDRIFSTTMDVYASEPGRMAEWKAQQSARWASEAPRRTRRQPAAVRRRSAA